MEGKALVYVIFRGKGNIDTYLEERKSIYTSYSPLIECFLTTEARHLQQLARDAETSKALLPPWSRCYELTGQCLLATQSPISRLQAGHFPLIWLTQLVYFAIISHILGTNPGNIKDHISGALGLLQGIVTAAAIAASED